MKKLFIALSLALLLFPGIAVAQAATATLNWNAVTTNINGQAITGVTYNVYRGLQSSGSDGVKLNLSAITVLTYVDSTINNTTVYYYSVSGISSTGVEGAKCTPVRFSAGDVIPATVTGLTVH